MRILFCWSDISGYMAACWKSLAKEPGITLRVYAFGNNSETNFNLELTEGLDVQWVDRSPDRYKLQQQVIAYDADVIVLCGWFVPAYRQLVTVNALKKRTKFVLAMDTPWVGTFRQHIGVFLLRKFVRQVDAVITSGERSCQYARRLQAGKVAKIQYGVDVDRLEQHLEKRLKGKWPTRFLYMGRYAPEKGIEDLMKGYNAYRGQVENPWELYTCGKGHLENMLRGDGVTNHGFVQPEAMDTIWESVGCLVLPSTFDPWPLIVVEACAAGLPVICTHESGSQVEVVRVYWNGLVINAGRSRELQEAMIWIHQHLSTLPEMGKRSLELARPYAATTWAKKIHELVKEISND